MAKRTKQKPAYLDASLSADTRTRDLLRRMTLEEKVRQMSTRRIEDLAKEGPISAKTLSAFFGGQSIGCLEDARQAPADSAKAVNAVQKYLIEKTRLGIPAMVFCEGLHGLFSPGGTVFPQAIGLGSTFNTDLIERMAAVIAREARAVGVAQALSPDLDLARDPRWGRVEETYGEDPFLVARMGAAYVRGMQGPGPAVGPDKIVCTVKHFAAHGSPEGGVNLSPVAGGLRDLYTLYLPPFRAAVVEAGALCVMPAYSEYDGVPASASKLLLTRVLREQWGFRGYTFSDYGGIHQLHTFHKTAHSPAEAGAQALRAGMDLEAPGDYGFGAALLDLVSRGEVSADLVDRAVERILRVKFLAGVFDRPWADPKAAARVVNAPAHRALARQAAQESIVLLKNAKDLLPLSPDLGSIAVIGPNAAVARFGDYSCSKDSAVTPLAGIRAAVSRKTLVRYAAGCGLFELNQDGFAEAVEAARQSEAAVVFLGGASAIMAGVGWGHDRRNCTCGEGFDRSELGAPGVQEDLVKAVLATGTPTVVVMVHGRPWSIDWMAEHVPAIVEAWYPGEEAGNALADVLFGKANPSGRLSISVPRSVGHVPAFYNHKPSARGCYHKPGAPGAPGRDYVFSQTTPLYPFGHGLSYTTFKYSALKASPRRVAPGGRVEVSVKVRNTGKRAGKEVVQLYVNDVVSSVTTPVKALRGFAKVDLKPGEAQDVRFTLGPADMELLDENMNWVVEPGEFEVMVAGLKTSFFVKDPDRMGRP